MFLNKILQFIKKNKHHGINFIWAILDKIILITNGLITSIMFARLSTKDNYGTLLFIYSVFGICSIISIPGVRISILRSVAQKYDGVYKKGTNYSFFYSFFGIPIVLFIGLYFYFFKEKSIGIIFFYASLFFPFFYSFQTWMPLLQAKLKFKQIVLNNFLQSFCYLALLATLLLQKKNIQIIIWGSLFISSFFHIFFYFKSKKFLSNQKIDPSWKKQGIFLSMTELSAIIFSSMDVMLVGLFLTMEQLAIYGIVMKFSTIFMKVIKSAIEVITPKIYANKKLYIQSFYKYFFLLFLIPLVIYPLIKYPIIFLYGNEYSSVIGYSQYYIFIIPFFFLASISKHFLIKYKFNKLINISEITAMAITLFSYFILIKYWGVLGGIVGSYVYFITLIFINLIILSTKKSIISQFDK